MLHSSLTSAGVLILCCATASGQQQLPAQRMLGPVKDAGVFHVGTGTWTRGSGSKANLGPDVIYRADVSSGYFGTGWEGQRGTDEGILPGMGNSNKTGFPGPREDYLIDGMEFGYCSLSAFAVAWDFTFYDSYFPCTAPGSPTTCINLAGSLPTMALPAGGFCWLGTFDFSLGGYQICMEADGGTCAPGYDGGGLGLDHFGWGAIFNTSDGATTGPMIAGHDVTWIPEGEGTVYQPAYTNACSLAAASGLGSLDMFAIDGPGGLGGGCFWFGGYANSNGCGNAPNVPPGQFHMVLYTDVNNGCGGAVCNIVFCDSDPNNVATAALSGCDCTTGSIILSLATGGLYNNEFTYPLVGLGTGVVSPTGVSELCIAGSTIGRYSADAQGITAGAASIDLLNANSGGGAGSVPTIGGSICNGTTWRFQWWHRNGMSPSQFSQGVSGLIQ